MLNIFYQIQIVTTVHYVYLIFLIRWLLVSFLSIKVIHDYKILFTACWFRHSSRIFVVLQKCIFLLIISLSFYLQNLFPLVFLYQHWMFCFLLLSPYWCYFPKQFLIGNFDFLHVAYPHTGSRSFPDIKYWWISSVCPLQSKLNLTS